MASDNVRPCRHELMRHRTVQLEYTGNVIGLTMKGHDHVVVPARQNRCASLRETVVADYITGFRSALSGYLKSAPHTCALACKMI